MLTNRKLSRTRTVLAGALLSLSMVTGVGLAVVPATPASAACTVGSQAETPYKSGSNIRTKIKINVSCKGSIRVHHWVMRGSTQVAQWETYYTTPYNGLIDRSAGTCRTGTYQVHLHVRLTATDGSKGEGKDYSPKKYFSC